MKQIGLTGLWVIAVGSLVLSIGSHSVHGQSVSAEPAGTITISPTAGSDTIVSIPLNRPTAYDGVVASVSGNRIVMQGSPKWTSNQYAFQTGLQPDTYFLSVVGSGTKSGMFYTITANDAGSVTVDPAGDDLSTLVAGEAVRIIPYWTLGTLFPGGQGVTASTSHAIRSTEILLPIAGAVGINNSFGAPYYYYGGVNPGWRQAGEGMGTSCDNAILPPDSYFIYRQNTSAQNVITVSGAVQVKPFTTPLGVLAANRSQDNYVAFPVAGSLTLAQTKLYESGAFVGSPSHAQPADELLVFDFSSIGRNPSPVTTYYYFTGTNPGWRKEGSDTSVVRDNDVVFQPGQGFIVRKAAAPAVSSSLLTLIPPYAQ